MSERAISPAFACAVLLIALSRAPCARAQSAGEWANGEQLWSRTCSYCHNDSIAPELRGAGTVRSAIIGAARTGPGAMPTFAPSVVSDAELAALADWLLTQKKPAIDDRARRPRHGSRQR